jgi:hypothetical protein
VRLGRAEAAMILASALRRAVFGCATALSQGPLRSADRSRRPASLIIKAPPLLKSAVTVLPHRHWFPLWNRRSPARPPCGASLWQAWNKKGADRSRRMSRNAELSMGFLIGEAPAKRRAKPGLLGLRVQCVEGTTPTPRPYYNVIAASVS